MPSFAANLRRLAVARETEKIPRDLAAWALELLEDLEPVAERHAARDALLREAAALVSGTRWAKARRLEREIKVVRSRLRERAADVDGVREIVERALEIDPDLPASHRHLLRIVA